MKKIYILAVGLCLSIILPLSTYATNGITENSDGSKTISRDGNTRTIAGEDLVGYSGAFAGIDPYSKEAYIGAMEGHHYFRGFEEPYFGVDEKSRYPHHVIGGSKNNYYVFDDFDFDHKYGVNINSWGGGNDTVENGYDSGNPRSERQGPCPNGWHVPSRGEWQDILMARCHLSDNDCEESDFTEYMDLDMSKIRIDKQGLGNKFMQDFSMYTSGGYNFWSSSPYIPNSGDTFVSWAFYVSDDVIFPSNSRGRNDPRPVRCFKDSSDSPSWGKISTNDETANMGTQSTNMNTGSTNTGTSIPKESNVDTGNRTTNEKIDIDKVNNNKADSKTIIPFQLFTYKQRNQSYGNPSDILENGYTREMNNAYNFAHTNGLISSSDIDKAKMNSPLTRIAMAKMLSNYAINILGKQPDTSKGTKNFNDVTAKQNAEYNNAVTLSYQLGIMGQGTNNNFRPNDEVTRAEFATALSRMLYSTPDGKDNYYSTHLNKLKQQGIITNDNPRIKEKRGYVMLMLMRSVM